LTIAGTVNATYTLPDVSAGTYYFALTSGPLTSNQILYATGQYTIAGTAQLTWEDTAKALVIGSSTTRGQLKIYSNNTNYLAFTPVTSALVLLSTYTWPAPPSVKWLSLNL